ncbi:MAG: hypothetical protein LBB91_03115, partial [Clostridiales bacterium]|nr:hypothetical protein [Clostridiales bacterium]
MKKYLLLVLTLFCLVFSGCAKITDDNNLNIIAPDDADHTPPDHINFYCQTTTSMQRFLSYDEFRLGMESAYGAAIDAWAGVKNLVFVKNQAWEKDNAFFTAKYLDADNYSASAGSDLKTALENQAEEKGSGLKIIITDLNSQLADYDTIAWALIDSALAKGLAVAIIGIDTPLDPYYIIAIGENRLVSDYIAAFKERPEIQDLTNAPESEFALDIVQPINYQILADKGGILGIDYEGIKFIEGYGSFSQVIEIDRAGLDRKEGMFNFQPSESLAAANTIKDGAKIPVRNLGAKSLLTAKEISLRTTETQQHYAGKIKFDMPFNIIEGVYLCAMDCQVETELFLPEGK